MMEKLKKTLQFIWNYKFTIILSIFLIYIATILGKRFNILHVITVLSFIFLLIFFAKTKYTLPFFILFGLLITIDVYFGLVFKAGLNVGMMASILDTHPGETQGAIRAMLMRGIPILLGTFGLLYLSKRELKKSLMSKKIAIILFSLFWFIFIPSYATYKVLQDEYWDEVIKFAKPELIHFTTAKKIPLIYNNLITAYVVLAGMDDFSSYANSPRETPDGILWDSTTISPEKIYLVIGESAWRDHMSLYGYPVKTTPFVDSLMISDTINSKYYKGIASATLTREVMKLALSFATPRHFDYFNKSKNLIEMARDANYQTHWISNQPRMGMHETSSSVISATADFSYHAVDYPMEDLDLVDKVQNALKYGKKQLFALHLDGSHIWYPQRYDELDEKSIDGVENDTLHYDRTLHHTDRVLKKLYETANNDGSSYVILYFSDHGEVIGVGHGFMDESTANIDIPFLTINNSQLVTDSIVSKYIDKKTNTINNTNVINIISEFAGYKTTDEYVKNAVEEGKYVYFPDMSVWAYEDLLEKNN